MELHVRDPTTQLSAAAEHTVTDHRDAAMGLEEVVDTHLHLWDPAALDHPWLRCVPELDRPFGPAELVADGATGTTPRVVGVVVVEADVRCDSTLDELDWIVGLDPAASGSPPVLGVVAGAALEQGPSAVGQLLGSPTREWVVGIRRLLQDEAPGFALAPEHVAGVRRAGEAGLVVDLCIRQHQLAEVTELVACCPHTRFALDHLGKPAVQRRDPGRWTEDLARLADLPNVVCKLSGLTTEADEDTRNPAELKPYLAHALSVFGADRCMFGSDWPVARTTVRYAEWLALVVAVLHGGSAEQRRQVLTGTARETYHLRETP